MRPNMGGNKTLRSGLPALFRPLPTLKQAGTRLALSRHQVLMLSKYLEQQPLGELLDMTCESKQTRFEYMANSRFL